MWLINVALTSRKSFWNCMAVFEVGGGTSIFGHSCPTRNTLFTSRTNTWLPEMMTTMSVSARLCW